VYLRLLTALCLLIASAIFGQPNITYAERLGYAKGAKVLILHIDDAGMSFDSNDGAITALTKGIANSVSVMMPCPWVPGFVQFLQQHPNTDAGLHLTLTSEWENYKWGPVAGKTNVPGLTDTLGALWPSVERVVVNATPAEVGAEIHAQFAKAFAMGFVPTHLDSHMGTLFASAGFLAQYVALGIEKNTPVMLPAGHNALIQQQMQMTSEQLQQLRQLGTQVWEAGLPVLDDLHNDSYGWTIPAEATTDMALQQFKTAQYKKAFASLKPGLTMMIMHCTNPSSIFEKITASGLSRKGDMLAMIDPALKQALADEHIIVTTWREIKQRRDALKKQ